MPAILDDEQRSYRAKFRLFFGFRVAHNAAAGLLPRAVGLVSLAGGRALGTPAREQDLEGRALT